MQFEQKHYTNIELVQLYRNILFSRMIEEKMLVLLRQGKVSKWFSGIGQEAISVGAAMALEPNEWIMPLHRNLGVFVSRGMPLHKLIMQWQGSREGYSKGRERSFHFGSRGHAICGMISHLGPQLALADGAALASRLRNEEKVTLAFTGEGATSEGDFHEALNIAAVWDLPVIFIIENNGYGLSTPVSQQYRCEHLVDKALGYGMEGVRIDGNNVLTVYDTVKGVRDYCIRNRKPYLIECTTFRMRGHEEASGTKYVPQHLFDEWKEKDPLLQFESFLLQNQLLEPTAAIDLRRELQQHIDEEWTKATQAPAVVANLAEELNDVYAPVPAKAIPEPQQDGRQLRFIDAIREALQQSMEKDASLVLMGQDIAAYGGAFKVTEGFAAQFGEERVRNTPLCESGVIGVALGLSLEGIPSVVEMQFADFVTVGFNQIVNNLAKLHYRWGQQAGTVIRMPAGGGIGAGPFHSQSNEAWFTHVPGLKVVYPSTPADAKGLLIAAINDPNPVMFFEHKALYRSLQGEVPAGYYETPIGKARVVQEGSDLAIITYGSGVGWATDYAAAHPQTSFYILDLRTLLPIDTEAVQAATASTGKVLILHEDTLTGGIGGEIAAWIGEHCFKLLDAPVMRCASLDTPIPFNSALEQQFLASARLGEYVERLLRY